MNVVLLETILLATMVGGGLFFSFTAITSGGSRRNVLRRLDEADPNDDLARAIRDQELRSSFITRVLIPGVNRAGVRIASMFGSTDLNAIERQMTLGAWGQSLTAAGFLTLRVVAAFAGLVLGLLLVVLLGLSAQLSVVMVAALGVAGLQLPKARLDGAVRTRQKRILRAMPAALDLLTICVQGGLSFDAALQEVVNKYRNPLTDELNTTINEMRLGRPRREALRALDERLSITEVSNLVDAILQSEQLGASMADTLVVQSEEIRRRRRQHAEELGQKAPIKMLLPLVGCVFPTIFVILLGPAALTVMRQVLNVKQ